MTRKTSTLTLLLLVLVLLTTFTAQAQSNIQEVIITEVNSDAFPQIKLRFRALDSAGFPVTNVQQNMLDVQENGIAIPPENLKDVEEGIWVQFLVDGGVWLYGEAWDNGQETIRDFVQTTPWMKENLDHVALSIVEGGGNVNKLVDFTTDGTDLLPILESYTPKRGEDTSTPVSAMNDLLDSLAILEEAADKPKFIVYLSAGMESEIGQIDALAEKSQDLNIPIYTVSLGNRDTDPLQKLAGQSGGLFTKFQNRSSLASLFTGLVNNRSHYDVSYRSGVNASGTDIPVELIANISNTGAISGLSSYDVQVESPRVAIKTPPSGQQIIRSANEYTTDLTVLKPSAYDVVASVAFPDGHIRRLKQANLLVDGKVVSTLQAPSSIEDLKFTWDLQQIQKPGDHSLEVAVMDELNLDATSAAIQATVDINVPEPGEGVVDQEAIDAQIQAGIDGALKSLPPGIEPINCFDFTPDWACDNLERPLRTNPISFVSIGIAMLSLGFAGVVYVKRDSAPVQNARDTLMRGVDRLTKKYRPSEARAYLKIIDGDINAGKRLEIYGTTRMGRARQDADLLFQQVDEYSPISRLHCTILDEEDHFLLRDEDSANGTYLNGKKLTAMVAEPLYEGDEIELARVERGGVRLMFETAQLDEGDEGDMDADLRETKPSGSSAFENSFDPNGKGGDVF